MDGSYDESLAASAAAVAALRRLPTSDPNVRLHLQWLLRMYGGQLALSEDRAEQALAVLRESLELLRGWAAEHFHPARLLWHIADTRVMMLKALYKLSRTTEAEESTQLSRSLAEAIAGGRRNSSFRFWKPTRWPLLGRQEVTPSKLSMC